jgi:integrase
VEVPKKPGLGVELDWDALEWLIPAERVKTGRANLVPLTPRMTALIGQATNGLVFPGRSDLGHVTNIAVNQRLKRLCERLSLDDVRTHTMRRTFITHMARLGVSVEIRNRLTNHADRSVDGIYCFHDFLLERREALELWGRELGQIIGR